MVDSHIDADNFEAEQCVDAYPVVLWVGKVGGFPEHRVLEGLFLSHKAYAASQKPICARCKTAKRHMYSFEYLHILYCLALPLPRSKYSCGHYQ
jgi:hypothetical protein